jgi:hypothetical protein
MQRLQSKGFLITALKSEYCKGNAHGWAMWRTAGDGQVDLSKRPRSEGPSPDVRGVLALTAPTFEQE